jgi:hypothetical protein
VQKFALVAMDKECLEMSPRLPSSQRKVATLESSKLISCDQAVDLPQGIESCSGISGRHSSWISNAYNALQSSFGFKTQSYERVVNGRPSDDDTVTFSTHQFIRFCGSGY